MSEDATISVGPSACATTAAIPAASASHSVNESPPSTTAAMRSAGCRATSSGSSTSIACS